MLGASIETTLELWAGALRAIKARMRPVFTQDRVASSAGLFLDGLLGDERRKTGWMRATAAGDPGPWCQQAILGRCRWVADARRDLVRDYVIETLGADDAVLVIGETGFLKQGRASCGVGRQYTGSAGKTPIARSASLQRSSRGTAVRAAGWHGRWPPTGSPRPGTCPVCRVARKSGAPRQASRRRATPTSPRRGASTGASPAPAWPSVRRSFERASDNTTGTEPHDRRAPTPR